MQTKISMQEKKLKAIESKKKRMQKNVKKLMEQSDVTKKEIAKFIDKKKKRRESSELVAKNRTIIENKNKELKEQNKKLQKQLAENQLFEQMRRRRKFW